jgi:hypothetical protein
MCEVLLILKYTLIISPFDIKVNGIILLSGPFFGGSPKHVIPPLWELQAPFWVKLD